MKSKKILAIWMDDTIAYLMESVNALSAFGKRENPHGSFESAGYFNSVVLNKLCIV